MKVEHLAIWVDDIELVRQFYMTYFSVTCSDKYVNRSKNYTSYFLEFDEGGSRVELMHRPDIEDNIRRRWQIKGLAHLAISVSGRDAVNILTERLRGDGFTIESEPRVSGDGYYESAVLDTEGNYVEIIA